MKSERISEDRVRRARVGTAACFLLTGFVSASWASRVPAIKDGLGLSDGQFAIAFVGLEAGAVVGLQLGGLVVPRTAGSNAPGETPATAAARVSTLGYLGFFVGPVLIVGMAALFGLPLALELPALLVLATGFGARAVRRVG